MNDVFSADFDDCIFDRLADGELNEPQRRELLATLDSRPDGWRRCALAFLESQEWNEQLKLRPIVQRGPTRIVPAIVENRGRNFRSFLAIAASALLAFSTGLLINVGSSRQARENFAGGAAERGEEQSTDRTLQANDLAIATADPNQRLITLAVAQGAGKGSRDIQVPIIEAASLQSVLEPSDSELIEQLKSMGHQVTADREYWPMPMHDGSTVVIPVDNVQVQFRGRTY